MQKGPAKDGPFSLAAGGHTQERLPYPLCWLQGIEVWGREGMRQLWSALNKVYGGGVVRV